MIITYFRSSSFNEWALCQMQYTLDYVLGIPQDSNKKAEMGTTFHKAMECLANATLHVRDKPNEPHFIDHQLGPIPVCEKVLRTESFADRVFNLSYAHYTTPPKTRHVFSNADKKLIYKWFCETLVSCNGIFDPRNRNIVAAEPHFDFEITEPWASYEFKDVHTGKVIAGKLHIKGTIDLVTQVGPNMYEVIDWKSGKRIDWGTGAEKDFNKLSVDPQLRMYHYAISRMYPSVKQVVMTINFVRDGGPYTMAYGPEDMEATLAMLKKRFEEIKLATRPRLKSNTGEHWFCKRVCSYGRNCHPKDPTNTICQSIKKKIMTKGIDEVIRTETHGSHTVSNYSNPGE